MRIGNLKVIENSRHTRVSAQIGQYPLWFRISAGHAINAEDASPFLLSAIIPAMLLGESIIVDKDYYISEQLNENLPEIQTIFNSFNSIFKKISISSRTSKKLNKKEGCATFFSAGVDSIYTAVSRQDEIDSLILINGFDFNMNSADWQHMITRNTELAQILNKNLVIVETNLKEFTSWFNIARLVNFGTSLATVANLLDFSKVHISSAETYNNIAPVGAHPILDPLFSTEACLICHTGLEADRAKKIQLFKDSPEILSRLWVCWKDPTANCGTCSKCIRSYIALKLCGIEDFEFQTPIDMKSVGKLSIADDEILFFFEDFRKRATALNMKDLEKQLNKTILKYKLKSFLNDIDFYLFNSRLRALKNFGKRVENDLANISISRRYTDSLMLEKLLESHQKGEVVSSVENIGTTFE